MVGFRSGRVVVVSPHRWGGSAGRERGLTPASAWQQAARSGTNNMHAMEQTPPQPRHQHRGAQRAAPGHAGGHGALPVAGARRDRRRRQRQGVCARTLWMPAAPACVHVRCKPCGRCSALRAGGTQRLSNARQVLEAGASVKELPGEAVELPPGQVVAGLGWSRDGQVLTVATAGGQLLSYLAALPAVFAASAGGRLAHLTSLSELAVMDCLPGAPGLPARLGVGLEPAFCAVGPEHVAAGLNNQVRRRWRSQGPAPAGLVLLFAPLEHPQQAACAQNNGACPQRRCCSTRTAHTAPPRSWRAASTLAPCPACGSPPRTRRCSWTGVWWCTPSPARTATRQRSTTPCCRRRRGRCGGSSSGLGAH